LSIELPSLWVYQGDVNGNRSLNVAFCVDSTSGIAFL
jgi:hypothetical protein